MTQQLEVRNQQAAELSGQRFVFAVFCLVLSGLLCLAVTRQSLWIDEATTAWLASHESSWRLLTTLTDGHNLSESLMPIFALYIWAWAKAFGTSEYALRAANIPFAIVLIITLGWTSRRVFGRPFLWVIFCFCPFVWFYMNEARPYVAVMACSAVSLAAVLAYLADPKKYSTSAPWFFFSAVLLGSAFHLLAIFILPAAVGIVFLEVRAKKITVAEVRRDWARPFSASLPFLLLLGAYFIWIVDRGAGGQRGHPGLGNLVFVTYEFTGFQGLGPPRNELRAQPGLLAFDQYWPMITVGVIGWLTVLTVYLIRVSKDLSRQRTWGMPAVFASTITLFFGSAIAVNFNFWGRHLAACFPLFVFALLQILGRPQGKPVRVMESVAFIALAVAWLISDSRLVLLRKYEKDDYRGAVNLALDEVQRSGGTIAWVANDMGGRYYGLEYQQAVFSRPSSLDVPWRERGQAVLAANWSRTRLAAWLENATERTRIIVVLSKPDLHDRYGAWSAALRGAEARRFASTNAFDLYILERRKTLAVARTREPPPGALSAP